MSRKHRKLMVYLNIDGVDFGHDCLSTEEALQMLETGKRGFCFSDTSKEEILDTLRICWDFFHLNRGAITIDGKEYFTTEEELKILKQEIILHEMYLQNINQFPSGLTERKFNLKREDFKLHFRMIEQVYWFAQRKVDGDQKSALRLTKEILGLDKDRISRFESSIELLNEYK